MKKYKILMVLMGLEIGGAETHVVELSKELKKKYGNDFVSLFVLGCCGDINHVNDDRVTKATLDTYREIGRALAEKTEEAMAVAKPVGEGVQVVKEKLSEGVMRPLVNRDEKVIKKILPKIIDEGWTSRRVERYFSENKKQSSAAIIKQYQYRKDEDALSAKYSAIVKISGRSLTFRCKTESALKDLLKKLS